MAKLSSQQLFIKSTRDPNWLRLSMPYNKVTHELLKSEVPGVHWYERGAERYWRGPAEMKEQIAEIGRGRGLQVAWALSQEPLKPEKVASKVQALGLPLYPHQEEAVVKALTNEKWIFNFEMGLGKTLSAITVSRAIEAQRVLIVCPAIVRLSWEEELARWWPEHPKHEVCDTGTKTKAFESDICITSYQLVVKLPKYKWDIIIIDESHYIANRKAARSKAVRKVLNANRQAHILFLSATPITNEPHQLHHQLDSLYPRRFGSFWAFAERYCEIDSNEYTDWWIHGTRNEGELEQRLAFVSSRVTKKEVEHLLPDFVVTPIKIKPARSFNPRELVEEFVRMDEHKGNNRLLESCTNIKISSALDWAVQAPHAKLVIATHLRQTAADIVNQIQGRPVFHFDGDTAIKQRKKILKEATTTPQAVLVCTMHSVKEGINDMVGFDSCLLAELYYTPGVMAQFLGRFHRLNGSCNVDVLCLQGTQDELVAARLREKLANVGKLYAQGVVSGKLDNALVDESEEEFFEGIKAVAENMLEQDEYLL